MKALQILVVLMLTACATPQEFMSRPADAQVSLKGAPPMAASCLARNLENYASNMVVTQRPTPDGQELIGRLHGEAVTIYAIADVRNAGGGSTATIWTAGQIFTSTENVIKNMVKGC
jgi:hypothetical protein